LFWSYDWYDKGIFIATKIWIWLAIVQDSVSFEGWVVVASGVKMHQFSGILGGLLGQFQWIFRSAARYVLFKKAGDE
jgi:hypothetical protein